MHEHEGGQRCTRVLFGGWRGRPAAELGHLQQGLVGAELFLLLRLQLRCSALKLLPLLVLAADACSITTCCAVLV